MKLTDREWKSFLFPEIFIIKGGFYNKKPTEDANGIIPFIGATDSNNGITQFNTVENINNTSKTGDDKNADLNAKIFDGNCIVVTNNGSVGYAYYQKHPFTCSHDVNPLYLKDVELTEELAHFLIGAIEKQRVCFAYVRKWRPKRMRKSSILLPIDKKGKPDYEFMKAYVHEMRENKLNEYKKFANRQIKEIGKYNKIKHLEEMEWKPFFIKDIFESLKRGKRIVEKDHIEGLTALVSSYGKNNGVTNFIGNKDKVKFYYDCLSIANGGSSAGKSFYHPYTFIASDHVTMCWNKELTSYQYLFLSTAITKALMEKYSFSREISDPRIAREKIMLPVTENGAPDFEYMEQYTKNLLIKKYSQYLNYIKSLPYGDRI